MDETKDNNQFELVGAMAIPKGIKDKLDEITDHAICDFAQVVLASFILMIKTYENSPENKATIFESLQEMKGIHARFDTDNKIRDFLRSELDGRKH